MKSRIISAIVMLLIVVPVLYFGGWIFDVAIAALAVISFKELIDVRKDLNIPSVMKIIGLICMLMLTFANIGSISLALGLSYETVSIVFLLLLAPTVFLKKYNYRVSDAFYLAAITLFIGVTFNLFITLYTESIWLFIWIIVIACSTDIFALLGGMLIGRHKFTEISPNKTIEGCICGALMAVIIGVTFYGTVIGTDDLIRVGIVTLILSIVGQIGDLFFSLIKRENKTKDFSNLIPGHGGILDRIDSIIFIIITFVFVMQYL